MDNNDLSNFLIPQEQDADTTQETSKDSKDSQDAQNNAEQNNAQESQVALTGVPYLDQKIQNGTLSAYDAYLANKYLGVNIGQLNLKANVDAQVKGDLKHTSITQTTKELGQMLTSLRDSDEVLKRSDLAGVYNGLVTGLNKKTGGFIGLDDERAKLDSAVMKMTYGVAGAMNDGKATNESRKEAKEVFGAGFRSQKELVARTAQAREAILNRVDSLLADLEAKGGQIGLDTQLINEIKAQKKKQNFLNSHLYGKKFNFETYEKSVYDDYIKNQFIRAKR
ncbi:hypothetical protein [Campylobacter cuniculorum]|uniref:Uncharacterized protein n=2 Tax=Campylobacter cuniculorum TaxID=374106 RepID=A0A1W6BUY6_9BACT|nr:hypothetical protein [Campylobacter cuniculorum]ARJ55913.1 hypothetical protein CCUN_0258 [Campylobacter cuniculorum DSM 23162 = LMG 24588]QOR05131.1 hypothetical protein A0071_04160 [Campylobacter cuniculorum]